LTAFPAGPEFVDRGRKDAEEVVVISGDCDQLVICEDVAVYKPE